MFDISIIIIKVFCYKGIDSFKINLKMYSSNNNTGQQLFQCLGILEMILYEFHVLNSNMTLVFPITA